MSPSRTGRRRRRIVIASVLAALAALAALTAFEMAFFGHAGVGAAGRLSTYLFINLVVAALFVLMFLVGRTFLDLYRQKKRRAAGYRFRTKLVTIFVLLVSVPAVLLFILTSRMVSGTVESWFSIRAEVPLESAVRLASRLYDLERERASGLARRIASGETPFHPNPAPGTVVRILDDPTTVAGSELARKAFSGSPGTEIDTTGHDEIVRAAAPVPGPGAVRRVVMVETVLPPELVRNIQVIRTAYENYKGLESSKAIFKTGYFLVLVLITAFVIFLTLLAALRVARSITDPVQALAEGTRRVATGRFDTTLAVTGDDELGQLTAAFNNMVAELKSGQERLKSAYAEMDSKRLILEGIMGNIETGVICLDRAGKVLTINNAACRLLGITPRDLTGLTYREILEQVEAAELREILSHLRDRGFGGGSWELNAQVRGVPVVLRLFLSHLRGPEGDPQGILVVFDDITQVVQAQRAQAWQEVARRMTHEIKNPLTPIKLSAERLLKKYRDGAPDLNAVLESSVRTIIREVDSLRKLVNEFSRIGRLPELRPEAVDLSALISDVVALYEGYRDLKIDVDLPAAAPPVRADREQLRRALINLMDNAVAAVEGRGRVWISLEHDAGRNRFRIRLSDDGCGIPPENRDRLFLPHFSTKSGGTGLGLAIVHKIVTDHGGRIRVEENLPRGARFVLELPGNERV